MIFDILVQMKELLPVSIPVSSLYIFFQLSLLGQWVQRLDMFFGCDIHTLILSSTAWGNCHLLSWFAEKQS